MSEISDLIARLEKASGADREIDARIAYAATPALRRSHSLDEWLQSKHAGNVRYYTWSVDDALTLMPELAMWSICHMEDGPFAQVIRPMPCGGYVGGLTDAKGSTPAIAFCIAALKAKASADRT